MDRLFTALGWVGGVVTVYGAVTVSAVASLFAATWALRAASRAVVTLIIH